MAHANKLNRFFVLLQILNLKQLAESAINHRLGLLSKVRWIPCQLKVNQMPDILIGPLLVTFDLSIKPLMLLPNRIDLCIKALLSFDLLLELFYFRLGLLLILFKVLRLILQPLHLLHRIALLSNVPLDL